jgi:hypothetical protein
MGGGRGGGGSRVPHPLFKMGSVVSLRYFVIFNEVIITLMK